MPFRCFVSPPAKAETHTAIEEDIPITDPAFYSSEILCPDSLITYIFRPAAQCTETIPLLPERIAIMREVGFVLCTVGCDNLLFIVKTLIYGRASGVHFKDLLRNFIEGTIIKEQPLTL
jgi:Potential Queuosine, Q, salvage protein family